MRIRLIAVGAAALLFAAGPLAAAPAAADALDPAEVADFLDTRVPELMEEQGIPGVAVSVVAGGEELLTTEYGVADRSTEQPMDAEDTTIVTGSVAKSFTAVAALQLVESGAVDLDADVNTYLPEEAQIADTYPGQPITMHHLLTHTAGFEEDQAGAVDDDPRGGTALADYVAADPPERIYPPGRYPAYSNYGITLAGYIVERVSGQPFDEYASEHVFGPAGMEDTAFAQSAAQLPGERDVATRYMRNPDGELEESPDLATNSWPAGSAFTTAGDMSRFMLAMLGGGANSEGRVLQEESVQRMLTPQFRAHPELSGVGYGSYEPYSSEPQIIGHHGDMMGVNMEWAVVPERDAGIFVAANGASTEGFQDALWRVIIDEFAAEFLDVERGVGATEPVETTQQELAQYAGGYHAGRVSHSEMTMLSVILGSYRPAEAVDGGLRMSCSNAPEEQRWIPVGDGLFHSADGEEWLGFIEDDGEVVGLICDGVSVHPYVAADWHETPFPWLIAAGAALLALLSMLAWPIAALVRRLLRRPAHGGRGPRAARWVAGAGGLLLLAALLTLIAIMSSEVMAMAAWTGSVVPALPLTLMVPVAPAAVVFAVLAWRRGWWGRVGRLHYTAVAAALPVFLVVAYHFNFVWSPW